MTTFRDIILWRDVKVTAVVFVSGFVFLVCMTQFSLLSVVTAVAMIALIPMLVIRLLFTARSAFMKTEFQHPLNSYLSKDINVSKDRADLIGERAAGYIVDSTVYVRRLFLVEDLADSIKLLVVLYILSYLAQWFSGITLTFIGFIGLFTVPKAYDMYREEINSAMSTIKVAVDDLLDKINAAVPLAKPKPVEDTKKAKAGDQDKDKSA
ncbi:reticulon-1-A [Nematostella vectensis]|uniref:reticulon-1-A n=1 Tax=Nematostella vectensis TaxID=45351 RepID=UPI0020772322|nr:reticulon-1-A [Nematostella vectensis]